MNLEPAVESPKFIRVYNCDRFVPVKDQLAVGSFYHDEVGHWWDILHPSVPALVDLRNVIQFPEVYDQGELGSCTGYASAKGMLEIVRRKYGENAPPMAALYVYYYERVAEHDINQDGGAQIVDAVYVLLKRGCATEVNDPYNISAFTQHPSSAAEAEAGNFKVRSAMHLHTLDDMIHCLQDGFPFIGGISVYNSFESQATAESGVVPMPQQNEKLLGGHAVCFIGYDMSTKTFLVRNSWGPNWGDHGYFHLPFDYATQYGSDFWTVR